MNSVRTLCCCLAGFLSAVSLWAQAPDVSGTWQGKLNVGATSLRIVLNIAQANGSLIATMDSPDQGAKGIPVTSAISRNDSLLLSIEKVHGAYAGRIAPDGSSIAGEWAQGSVKLPLEFHRSSSSDEIRRPQDPIKPYPYTEQEVIFSNKAAGLTLAGTLTTPQSDGPFPAVVLISGSGPQNRDCMILGHRPFLVIADYLTRRGIAVLRFDERGVGQSTGVFASATSQDFASDVRAAVEWLAGRSDIDKQHIGLIGHSEGGIVAPMVAAGSPDIAFIVLLAAPGLPGKDIIAKQSEILNRAGGMSGEELAASSALQRNLQDAVLQANDSADLHNRVVALLANAKGKEKELVDAQKMTVENQMPILSSPWFRFFLGYDPQPALRKVTVPVLALNGEKDVQVAPENLKAVEQALKAGGNKAVTTRIVPSLNHLFQTTQTGLPSEYGSIEETFSPKALDIIGEWVAAHARKNKK